VFYKKKFEIIQDSNGSILKLLKIKNKFAKNEIYINKIKPNVSKGWNLHKKYTCNIFLIKGDLEFLICKNSKKGKIKKIKLSLNKVNQLIIKPNNWFCFRSNSKKKEAIFMNLTNGFHSSKELIKKPVDKFKSPIN